MSAVYYNTVVYPVQYMGRNSTWLKSYIVFCWKQKSKLYLERKRWNVRAHKENRLDKMFNS